MLYIIVPVHNRVKETLLFMDSIAQQSYKNYKVIIVDDGSTDGTADIISGKYDKTIIIKGNGQLFWGGGINLGLDYVKKNATDDDFIVLANNDVKVLNDTINNLLAHMENKLGVYHSLVLDLEGKVISSGAKLINWIFFSTYHPLRNKYYDKIKNFKNIEIDLMTARFVIFSFKVLRIYSKIDTENFPHYVGDNDFSMSLKKMGVKTYIVPSSRCILDESTTGENPQKLKSITEIIRSFRSVRSTNNIIYRIRFGKKHCPRLLLPFYIISMFTQLFILNIVTRKK